MMNRKLYSSLEVVLGLALAFFLTTASNGYADNLKSVGEAEIENSLSMLDSPPGVHFVHTANADNITESWTVINHPLTNNNPDAIIYITQNWNPGGGGSQYNDHSISVLYESFIGRWAIFNQDVVDMPTGADFNVFIPAEDSSVFVHTATAANITSNWTEIDHPLTNDNPDAIVQITQNFNPGGVGGQYNDHSIGVYYRKLTGRWAIFNQDIAAMPEGAAFNVIITAAGSSVFVHTATAANITGHITEINHPLTNNNPNAIIHITQNYNPGAGLGQYNDHSIGVYYREITGRWAVFNQDIAGMPAGADFNVIIPAEDSSVFVHTATAANITGNITEIDHPLTNDNPTVIVHITQNYNPGGGSGKYNDHPIIVGYSGLTDRWVIVNQDLEFMPAGADFNVTIPTVDTSVFVHIATADNIFFNHTEINHPLTNDKPDAIIQVTQNYNFGGGSGTYNEHSIGVFYKAASGKWAVFNQDFVGMPEGAEFNVTIPSEDSSVFVHSATAANITSNWTEIDHSLTNDNPNAIVLITQNYNPGGIGSQYNDHSIGVWYNSGTGRWAIFNQDHAGMPKGADFNVKVYPNLIFIPLVVH